MSREILYRGKRTYNKKWIEGSLVVDYAGNTYIVWEYETVKGAMISSKTINVYPETVGEYTGLTDKNGKRIFEGDIVKCRDLYNDIEFTAVVEFGNPNSTYSWGWQLYPISGNTYVNLDILLWIETEETGAHAEIIGNIHDNPELLEVSE